MQARFELDEDWQRISVINQMGNMWRAHKSRRVKVINLVANNQERMNLRPTNINPVEWQKFVKLKTNAAFKKLESGDPSSVTRLQVWIKSRTKKDGTPVDTNAAEKIQEAAKIVGSDAPTFSTNPDEDHLAKLLGPDNPGRLRVMGRDMSKTKLACLQVKNKCMAEMEERQVKLKKQVNDLEDEIIRIKNQRPEAEMGENSAARSVNRNSHRPTDLKVLVETAYQPDAFLWRPAHKIFNMKEAVGHIIAWPADKCKLLDTDIQIEDIAPLGLKGNKCKLLDLKNAEVIVAERRWETQEPSALVNGLPLGPKAVKKFLGLHRRLSLQQQLRSLQTGPKLQQQLKRLRPSSPIRNTLPAQSPLRKSPRINKVISKENKKCKLMDLTGKNKVVAEGRWATNDPEHKVHHTPLGFNAVKGWIDIVKVGNVKVWRPSDEIEIMEDALSSCIAWPENKVIMS
ncbi:putative transposase Ptta/En/Spm plant [Arabidopsis suecica]|uniref:Putative transposase Ptta/En/Spm plant n=1 Tax=Arabidopsis suecica TaxID=45249 RepID=A0A8T1XBH6_ARASU|nr:putative transposase Ptta/En/Spm plant [Arabidopsis suecica]KAG7530317.1 putative transposase Ptta/En/Spm plant [Arabidopsis suecica]